jgi:ribosomal protein S17
MNAVQTKVAMKVGDRVRVKESVVVYHHPSNRNQAFDLKGLEGQITDVITERDGKPISANLPYVVAFDGSRFRAHLREVELETIA